MGTLKVDTIQDSGGNTILSSDGSGGFSNNLPAGKSGSFRNIIINGDMSIAQRGTSSSSITTSNYYTVDRFNMAITTLGTWTQSQSTDVPSGQGFAKSLKIECTTADASPASGDVLQIQQKFEGQNLQYLKYGTANASSLTLSFWVKSNKTGTYVASFYNNDNARHISKSYTIDTADTWEKKTITYAGDTVGALDNDNASSLLLILYMGAGTDFTSGTLATSWNSYVAANACVGQVNLADSTSNYINITGIQLEAGTTASDFEFLPVDVNRRRCDRYFQRILSDTAYTAFGAGTVFSATLVPAFIPYRQEMRASPTFSQSTLIINQGNSSKPVTSVSTINAGKSSLYVDISCSSGGMTVGFGAVVLANNSTSAYVQMDAEL